MLPRPLTLLLLLLVLLSVTGCTTVTPGAPPADDRPQGVRGQTAVPDHPAVSTSPTPLPVTAPSQRSALVQIEPGQPRRTSKSHRTREQRTRVPVQRPHAAASPQRPDPRVRPADPQRPVQPRVRPRPKTQRPAPQAPPLQPQPHPGQMRDLCRRADGVASSGIVDLCRQTWG
ncbi:hypothetical protein ACIA6D_43595 [Streptomyces cacaoi]